MPIKSLWLSYDISFGGDYETLFTVLDKYKAKECGEGVAYLKYEYQTDFLEELKQDLSSAIRTAKDRAYVIYKEDGKMHGKWLFGKRKKAPWSGYAFEDTDIADDEA